MKIRLIGLDLDGTLFNDEKHITQRTKQALVKAMDRGVIVVIATGRPVSGISQEVLQIPGIQYAVTANGASIIELKNSNIIYQNTITAKDALSILKQFSSAEIMKEIYIHGQGYAEKTFLDNISAFTQSIVQANYILETRKPVQSLIDFLEECFLPVEKIHFLFSNLCYREKVKQELSFFPHIVTTSAFSNNLEINHATANKGQGLLELGKLLGIQKEEIMAFGDSENDLAMIQMAGFGIAMQNAEQNLKDVAKFITLSNNQDGIAFAIEKFIL